jgi:hypothetical protein
MPELAIDEGLRLEEELICEDTVAFLRERSRPHGRISLAANAALVALVKPQFELGLATRPTTAARLPRRYRRRSMALSKNAWRWRTDPVTISADAS